MASSPPASPSGTLQRSLSATLKMQRSSSRMSIGSKQGGGSRASDEDGKTAVKVGECITLRRTTIGLASTNAGIYNSCTSTATSRIN